MALQQYLTVAPWAVSIEPSFNNDVWAVPDKFEYSEWGCECDGIDMNYFQWAAQQGGLGVLKILLDHITKGKDPDLQIRFESGKFLLLNDAAQLGQVNMVRFLLNNQPRYASIHERDIQGYTALASAAAACSLDWANIPEEGGLRSVESEAVMNLLLDQGASATDVILSTYEDEPKIQDTILTLAVEWAGSQLVKRLIDGGADIYAKVTRGPWDTKFWNLYDCTFEVNALYVACTNANFEAVKTLIDCRGPEVDILDILWQRDSRGSLPLHWVTQSDLLREDSISDDKARNIANIIQLLLDLDPTTINIPDTDGNTPLHYATRSRSRHDKMYIPILQLLCARGGDASIRNTEGQTPLHTLFRFDNGNRDIDHFYSKNPVDTATVLTLVAHGASPADIDKVGDTPLHIAAANLEWADAISLLLVHGADPALPNLNGQTALHRAAGGTYMGRNLRCKAPERIRAQEDVFSRLVKAGGVELMDLVDLEGLKPREICHKTRQGWRELDDPPKRNGTGRGRGRAPRMHKM
ncbi:ankyrin protein [Fusarium mundagurra]|uniref:Ankyrin protein n=1 Tax=Fusarium mundagurra TaxID=1567541 RepID=A0A8H5YYG4_9HYPO|nr:ankyrin protein [Fusarium mundagurra]